MNSPWLTIEQACEYLQVSRNTMKGLLKEGLKHATIGRLIRIHVSDLDARLGRFDLKNAGTITDLDRALLNFTQGQSTEKINGGRR